MTRAASTAPTPHLSDHDWLYQPPTGLHESVVPSRCHERPILRRNIVGNAPELEIRERVPREIDVAASLEPVVVGARAQMAADANGKPAAELEQRSSVAEERACRL